MLLKVITKVLWKLLGHMEATTNHEGGPSQIYLTFGVEPKKLQKKSRLNVRKEKCLWVEWEVSRCVGCKIAMGR